VRVWTPASQRLLTRARLVRVPAGSVMYREGETGELLDLVVGGLVRVFVTAPDGRSLTVRYARRGGLIGVVSMYAAGFTMPAGIQAVVEADLLRLSPDVVRWAAAEDPRVADALLRELADRVLSFIHEIPDSAFTSVRQRIARHLLDLATQEADATTKARAAADGLGQPTGAGRGSGQRARGRRPHAPGPSRVRRDQHSPGSHRHPQPAPARARAGWNLGP